MPIRAVIFDFNGVLVDDEEVHYELFREVLAAEGVALDEATYHAEYLGFDDRGVFTAALAANGRDVSPADLAGLIARKAARYADLAEDGLLFFPDAAESIRRLAASYPVAVCSGALRAEIEYALDRLGVRDLVGSITSAEDTKACKPDPEGYLIALARLREDHPDLDAGSCLVIEDSLAGLAAAKLAGMTPVAVGHTYTHPDLTRAGAVAIVEELGEVTPTWIEGLGR